MPARRTNGIAGSQPRRAACKSASTFAEGNRRRSGPTHPQEHVPRDLCRGRTATTTPVPPLWTPVPEIASNRMHPTSDSARFVTLPANTALGPIRHQSFRRTLSQRL
jgi:hypothetical protein